MNEQLKPCPFCGGSVLFGLSPRGWHVSCDGCSTLMASAGNDYHTREEAASVWNRRQLADAQQWQPLPDGTRINGIGHTGGEVDVSGNVMLVTQIVFGMRESSGITLPDDVRLCRLAQREE